MSSTRFGVAAGTARVVAQGGGFSDTVEVSIRNVRMLPADTTVSVGSTFRYRVVRVDSLGKEVPVANATFSERDSGPVLMTRVGRLTAVSPVSEHYHIAFDPGVGWLGARVTVVPLTGSVPRLELKS